MATSQEDFSPPTDTEAVAIASSFEFMVPSLEAIATALGAELGVNPSDIISMNTIASIASLEDALEMATTETTDTSSSGTDQNIAVLTPVSDFVFNFRDETYLWGRHGNDVLLGFDPASPIPEAPEPGDAQPEDFKWNVLLGDYLDENILGNRRLFARPDETGVNGEDRFILGDWRTPYYLDNFTAGAQQAAIIVDFEPGKDTIQLHGSREDYTLIRLPLTVPDSTPGEEPQTFFGQALVYIGEDPTTGEEDFDLIAYFPRIPPRSTESSLIGGVPFPDLDLNDTESFIYVGDTPPPASNVESQIIQIGTAGVDLGTGLSVDPFGNVYVTGVTTGVLGDSNEGSYDIWVAKYDSYGNQEWIKQFGTVEPDIVWDIETFVADNGDVNFYLVGSTTGVISDALGGSEENDGYQDIWLARFDSNGDPVLDDNGNPVFVAQNGQELERQNTITPLGSEIDNSLQIDVDAAGNVFQSAVTVEAADAAEVNGLQDFAWVASFDPAGNQRWINDDSLDSAEGFGFDESYGVAVANDGTTFAVGFTQLNIAGPDRLIGVYDAWISRFDENGEQIFIDQFGSTNYDFAWGVDTDSENNAYIVGATAGDILGPDGNPVASNAGFYDIFLAKYTADGDYEWAVQFGTEGDDAQYLGDIVVDAHDNIYITGFTNSDLGGPNQGGYDTWVASYDVNGHRNWITQFGSSGQDNPASIDVDNNGAIYITGSTEGSLGGTNAGASDAWIAKLDAATGALVDYGTTILNLGDGDNDIKLTSGNYIINAGAGNDRIGLGTGVDVVNAGDGDNFIYMTDHFGTADGAKDILTGDGNDRVKGGSGDDRLDLGTAEDYDIVFGRGGSDTFVLNQGSGYLIIRDFEQGVDKLDIGSLGVGDIKQSTRNGKTWLSTGGDTLAELTYFTDTLTAADFITA